MGWERHGEDLATDLSRLKRQLGTLCQDGLELQDPKQLRVLDLACGECFEAATLQEVLRELGGDETLEVDFVGADIRPREIARAAERWGSGDDGVTYRFLVKDAQELAGDLDLGEAFDAVIVRHQNYYLGGKQWHAIFEQGLEKLAPKGKLVITSYFDHEHALAKKAIQNVGGELIADLANREARALRTRGKYVDKRLALFRRGKTR